MVDIEPLLEEVTNKNLVHLANPRVEREIDVLWVLGTYLEYIEYEDILQRNKGSTVGLLGYFRYKRSASKWIKMPELGIIPGINLTKF